MIQVWSKSNFGLKFWCKTTSSLLLLFLLSHIFYSFNILFPFTSTILFPQLDNSNYDPIFPHNYPRHSNQSTSMFKLSIFDIVSSFFFFRVMNTTRKQSDTSYQSPRAVNIQWISDQKSTILLYKQLFYYLFSTHLPSSLLQSFIPFRLSLHKHYHDTYTILIRMFLSWNILLLN